MKRWNGWGDASVSQQLPAGAAAFLAGRLGPGTAPHDVAFDTVVASVPCGRLPRHPLVSTDPAGRALHARGQSLPDWIALRSGRIGVFPDAVAYPQSNHEVRELLRYADQAGVRLIPYGGGTSVVGHVNPEPGDAATLSVDLSRLCRLLGCDTTDQIARFGAGIAGPDLEAELRARGFTLGHFPQSFEHSTLGGWIVTRSSGQQSLGYGRIERLFAGGRLEAPAGTLDLPSLPASAAGPDLRELVLGSEGRLGILTEASVRITRLPECEEFHGVFFPDWQLGNAAVRELAQARVPLSMLRLSTPRETESTLRLAGHARVIALLESYLALRGARQEKCLMLLGATGHARIVAAARRQALAIVRSHGGVHTGQPLGRAWSRARFRSPYLRNTLWEHGYAVDTLETAAPWSRLPHLLATIESALRDGLAEIGERVHVFSHISHVYPDGGSLYTTYLFRLAALPEQNSQRWRRLKGAASQAIVRGSGTISHQHGVGVDHRAYLAAEKGELGLQALRTLASSFDPEAIMNPGKLF